MNPTGYPIPPQQPVAPQPLQARRYDGQDGSPLYDTATGGHYGASSSIAAAGAAPPAELFVGPYQNVSQGLSPPYRDILNTYWQNQINRLENEDHDYKMHQLPLARIKKVMKADPEVKMISAEAPILFAKGCDIFITELTMRAWIHAEENKRRTLQRSDIASALAKSDMFDFLIDIVPREDATPQHKRRTDFTPSGSYQVADPQIANAGAQNTTEGPPQQVAPPAHQLGIPDYTGMQQMPSEQAYHPQTGMSYAPAAQPQFTQQPQQFVPNNLYQPYGMPQQQGSIYAPQDPTQQYQAAPQEPAADDGEIQDHYGPA
ncbi:hypothetical protein MBLNU457_g0741t1 [Dothideomycetes sp. NU457]